MGDDKCPRCGQDTVKKFAELFDHCLDAMNKAGVEVPYTIVHVVDNDLNINTYRTRQDLSHLHGSYINDFDPIFEDDGALRLGIEKVEGPLPIGRAIVMKGEQHVTK